MERDSRVVIEFVVEYEIDGDCWTTLGSTDSQGYAIVRHKQRVLRLGRAVYSQFVADIPSRKEVKRTCGNRACVRPSHQYVIEALPAEQVADIRRNAVCRRGHELTDDNVYYFARGGRYCKRCAKERNKLLYKNKSRRNAKINTNE